MAGVVVYTYVVMYCCTVYVLSKVFATTTFRMYCAVVCSVHMTNVVV